MFMAGAVRAVSNVWADKMSSGGFAQFAGFLRNYTDINDVLIKYKIL